MYLGPKRRKRNLEQEETATAPPQAQFPAGTASPSSRFLGSISTTGPESSDTGESGGDLEILGCKSESESDNETDNMYEYFMGDGEEIELT